MITTSSAREAATDNRQRAIALEAALDLIPPYGQHAYFEAAERFAFHGAASSFDLVNAWWLAELSALAYGDADFVRPRLEEAGMRLEASFDSRGPLDCRADLRAFVIQSPKRDSLIVAVKGSSVAGFAAVRDLGSDLHFHLVRDSDRGGRVHHGFRRLADHLWIDQGLRDRLASARAARPDLPVHFAGHSLGGAIATLLAASFDGSATLHTFGSPRVGDRAFAKRLDQRLAGRSFRYVNNNDLVPLLPLALPVVGFVLPRLPRYRHVAALRYIDHRGVVRDRVSLAGRFVDALRGRKRFRSAVLAKWLELASTGGGGRSVGQLLHLPLDELADHAPLYYMRALRNAVDRS